MTGVVGVIAGGVDDRRRVRRRRDRPGERVVGSGGAVAHGHGDAVRPRGCREGAGDDTGGGSDRGAGGQAGGAVGERVAVGVGRVGVQVGGVSDGIAAVLQIGAEGRVAVDHGHRRGGHRVAVREAVVDHDAHADEVAVIAVAGGRQVQRRARRAHDVEPVERPLVARGQRVAVGVVARHRGGEQLVRRRRCRRDVTVSTTGGELAGGETDQVRVSVAVRVPSLTVTTTLCVPAGAVRVPLMTPVAGAIVTPAGRSVAL